MNVFVPLNFEPIDHLAAGDCEMDTIVIFSNTLTPGNQAIRALKELFPDCSLLILSKKALASENGILQTCIEKISPQAQSPLPEN